MWDGVYSYETAKSYLGTKTERKIGNNTRLHQDGDNISLILHQSAICIYHSDGSVTINLCGWDTVTTRARIRKMTPCNIWREKGQTYIHAYGSKDIPLVSNTRVRFYTNGEIYFS